MARDKRYTYLAKNTVLFSISSFGSKILVFLLVPLYTNVLSTSEYGIADIITTSIMLMGYLFTLNIGDAVLRFAIDNKEPEKLIAYGVRILLKGTILVGIILRIIDRVNLIPWPSYCFVYMALYYFGLQLSSLLSNYLRAIDQIKYVALSGIITTALTVISNIVFLLLFKLQLYGYLLSMVIGVLGTSLFQLVILRIPLSHYLLAKCDKQMKKEMLLYSVPLIFNGVAWWINSSLDKYFITFFIGTAAAGVYAVAYKIPTMLTMIQTIFNQAWNLSAIREYEQNGENDFFSKTYSFYNAVLVLACSILLIFNIPIARILFAKDFFEAWRYAPFLIISTLFSTMSGFVGSVFSAAKNSKAYAVSTVIAAILNTILNAYLIPAYGITGAALATALSFFFIWLIRLIYSRKYIIWKVNLKKDALAYLFLVVQAGCAIVSERLFTIQCGIFVVLLAIYYTQIASFARILFKKVRRKQ